jgi:hypothetical protein
MAWRLAGILLGSGLYGFAIGSVHSGWLARWNLVKFPLLVLLTGAVCGIAYYLFARFVAEELTFAEVWDLSMDTYRDASVLLASLAPVSFFLANAVEPPGRESLGEYPFFLGFNVALIALCGGVALVRQAVSLLRRHGVGLRQSVLITVAWLGISLFAGGQACWYFRPYFGVSSMPDIPLIEGPRPDYRGAMSFYEAVWNLVDPPPLPEDYWRHR